MIKKNDEKNGALQILLLEDSSADVELIEDRLHGEGLEYTLMVVDSGDDYEEALKSSPDIILADYHLPLFDGAFALAIAREKYPDIPFIFVTGAIGEEKAVETLRKGATDFVLKKNLVRLGPAIRRALKERKMMDDRHLLFEALKDNEERYRSLVENLPVGVFRTTVSSPGRFLQANRALARMHGVETVEELLKLSPSDLYADPSQREMLLREISTKGFVTGVEILYRKKNGGTIWGSITASFHRNTAGSIDWIEGILEDVTEKKEALIHLNTSLRFLETLIDTVSNPVFYKDLEGVYLGCNLSFAETILGMPREEIIGKTVFDLRDAIPEDLAEKYWAMDRALIDNPGVQVYEARVECADGVYRSFMFNKATFTGPDGETAGIVGIMLDITDRVAMEMEMRQVNEEMNLLLRSITSIIIGVSVKDRITHWNIHAEKIFNITGADVIGKKFHECGVRWDWDSIYEAIGTCITSNSIVRLDDLRFVRHDDKDGILGITINPLIREGEILSGFIILGRDVTESRKFEQQLQQARRLEAIGQLASGVAHEINSPLQYVGDNLKFIIKSIEGIIGLQNEFMKGITQGAAADGGVCADAVGPIKKIMDDIDIDYLVKELPKAAEQSLDGIERVSKIVQSMKAFAHPGTGTKNSADINKSIENTVTISRNEWKYESELVLDLDTRLPMVPCFEAELNQVILNLIINSVDSIKEAIAKKIIGKGEIKISTQYDGRDAVIRVEDNGMGIPENIRMKVFNPFFTTKEIGKGTGQGLAISHTIITEKHGGVIYFENKPGHGTAFVIRLPVE